MEISSIPFVSQEDFSGFFGLFQEFDTIDMDATNKKRQNIGFEENPGFRSSPDTEMFSTLVSSDNQNGSNQDIWEFGSDQQLYNSNFQSNSEQKSWVVNDSGTRYSDVSKADKLGAKRTRHEAAGILDSGEAVHDRQRRRLWVKDRSKAWWDYCNSQEFPDEEFKKAFRMSKATFDMICQELDSAVTKKDTMLRLAIPVCQRVAVCIWRLATGEPLRLVSKRFGLGISTCHKLVLEVCAALRNVLMPKFLQWPDENKLKDIKNEFEAISGIPNAAGSIYTTHIPIIAPKISVAAYYNKRHTERNQKTSYSITVQGVVDPKGIFTDVCIGWPGSMSDDKVLEKSALYQRANRGLLKDVWVVGNSGYPLMDWLLVPYTHQNLTWGQHSFNAKIEENQRVAKEAFMRLKARWTCLQKRTEVKLQDLPALLGGCCVLHNICEMNNETLEPELKFDLFDDEMVAENSVRHLLDKKSKSSDVTEEERMNLLKELERTETGVYSA